MMNETYFNRKMIGQSSLLFIFKIFGTILTFLLNLIISRNFNAAGVGLYSLSNSILHIATILSIFGFENSIIKSVSINYAYNNGKTIKDIKKTCISVSFIISIVLIIFVYLFSRPISLNIFYKLELVNVLRVIIMCVLPTSLIQIYCALLKGTGFIKTALFLDTNMVILINIVLIGTCFFVFESVNVNLILLCITLVSANIITVIICFLVWRKVEKKLNNLEISPFNKKKFMKLSSDLLLVSATNYMLSSTDILMLGIWSSEQSIGIYNVSTKITTLSSMLLIVVNTLIGPVCARLYEQNKKQEIRSLVQQCIIMMLVCAVVFLLVCFFCGKFMLNIFGQEFISGYPVLMISAVGQFVVLATGPVATVLMMTGHERMHRNNTLFCAVLNLLLNFFLIPQHNIYGAAIATTISLIVKNIIAVVALKRLEPADLL